MSFFPDTCPECQSHELIWDVVSGLYFCAHKECPKHYTGFTQADLDEAIQSSPSCPNCGGNNVSGFVHSSDFFCEDCSLSFIDVRGE